MIRDAEKRIGTVLNKYKIKDIVQKGGMGTVFLASHIALEKVVAIKIFHSHLADSRDLVRRFINEAKGTAKLRHRNIVDIIDIGIDPEGVPYFVMEYLTGETLKDRLKRKDTLSINESADIMIQVLTGLHVAHAAGIIHRDLKPGNIFINREADGSEIVKVLDFGVAKFQELRQDDKMELTADGTLIGTPSYMSPEQARGKKGGIGFRSDIYSCGLILYRCLTGINPFRGESQLETIQNIIHLDVPPPSFINEALPPVVDDVMLRAIAKDKNLRYKDCREFIENLRTFYDLSGVTPAECIAKIVSGDVKLQDIPSDIAEASGQMEADSFLSDASGETVTGVGVPIDDEKPMKAAGWKMPVLLVLLVAVSIIAAWSIFFRKDTASNEKASVEITPLPPLKTKGKEAGEPAVGGKGDEHGKAKDPGKSFINIRLTGLIEGATVSVDGETHEENPLKLEQSDEPVLVVVNFEGQEVYSKSIVPSGDEELRLVNLEKPKAIDKKRPDKSSSKAKDKKPVGDKQPDEPMEKAEKKEKAENKEKKDGAHKIFKDFPD
ncbi:MAG: serine/threonine-protein kinase [Pseudomonadota bacterium]